MRKTIGLELTKETTEISRKNKKVASFIKEHNLEVYDYGVIITNEKDVDFFIGFFQKEDVFDAKYSLFKIETPEQKSVFTDFGFISYSDKSYLYEELIIPFTTSGNNEKDVSAALEQMDEHLVAIDRGATKTIYFVERYHQQLIEGIADAYNINVIFYL